MKRAMSLAVDDAPKAPDNGAADSFVHITAVQAAGMQTLTKDQRLSYDVERGRNGKESAVNLAQA